MTVAPDWETYAVQVPVSGLLSVKVTRCMFVGVDEPLWYVVLSYTTAPDSVIVGVAPGPAIVTEAVPDPVHDTVTTTCVAPVCTLKL